MPVTERRPSEAPGAPSVRFWPAVLLLSPAPVIAFGFIGVVTVFFKGHEASPIHSRFGLLVAVAIGLGALLIRRRHPFAALAIVLLDTAIVNVSPPLIPIALIALLTIAMLRTRREAVVAAIVCAAVLLITPTLHGHGLTHPGDIISRLVSVGLAVALGLYLRARQDYFAGLHDRAERAERERELLARQAVADERVRIARELHDAVAHNVSLMVVQAQALEAGGADAKTEPALRQIAGLGREALSEMRRMLGVLRLDPSDGAERAPQPGVADLDTLIDQVRQTGLDAALHVEGAPRTLSAGVELSAYRIVQEALTNVVRHAEAHSARVTLRYAPDALELQIVDDGVGPSADSNGDGGHGLVGMRERVALFGGELRTGRGPTGRGYQVRASLPLS
jgi:signal transduction histidine kinase